MLKVKDVHFSRGRRKILDGVSFDLPEGNLMALLGPSGCGKTTLLRLIAGFERLPQGEIEIKGQVVASGQGTHTSAYDRRVGFVFQNSALFPHMSVYDNITFGVPPNSSQLGKTSLAQELLEVFEIAHLKHKKPYEISGGEQQRVAIARALFPQPKLLLMDEPLAHLDSELRLRMIRELKARLTELKVTCVMVTHSQKEESAYTHKILQDCLAKLQEGKGVQEVMSFTDNYLTHPTLLKHSSYAQWPQHNSQEHMELMISSSEELAS